MPVGSFYCSIGRAEMRGPDGKSWRTECDYRNGVPTRRSFEDTGKDTTAAFPFDSSRRLLIGLTGFLSCACVQKVNRGGERWVGEAVW